MAKRMTETLQTPGWSAPLPVPTVDRKDKRWKSNGFWRGDVWPATNYQIAVGLAQYGHKDLAAQIADKTVANAIKNGISEHYDSVSGKALGVPWLGMTCTILTMMLEGLCQKHELRIKKAQVRLSHFWDADSHRQWFRVALESRHVSLLCLVKQGLEGKHR